MNSMYKKKILIVDDDKPTLDMLSAFLNQYYDVYCIDNTDSVFDIISEKSIDLCISDINMPNIKGFDLIAEVKRRFPDVKTALITAYDVNDYIRLAKEHDISNIIVKSVPFNFNEFNSVIYTLLSEKIFGLERYFLEDYTILGEYIITSSDQISSVENDIINIISTFHNPEPYINILLEELITNAVYHAPVDDMGREKYKKHSQVKLDDSEAVKVSIGRDSEKYGVSVFDNSGKLTKKQVLYRIDRHINGEGVFDENGRGLHMSRMYSDRFIINIKKNVATEAIFINYLKSKYKGYKPLYINEI